MPNFKQKIRIKAIDKKRYIFPEARDYEILYKIYDLENERLSGEDKRLVKFIRTQLMRDWRKPLLAVLNKLVKKYI